MLKRSQARDAALQVLYQDDLNARVNPAVGDEMLQERLPDEQLLEFARELVAGVRRNRDRIDQMLSDLAANWSVDRMAVTDRCVLRLGAYEILYGDTPNSVAIDEAIELAKRFGTAQSAQFVNGVLDRLMNESGKPKAESG